LLFELDAALLLLSSTI